MKSLSISEKWIFPFLCLGLIIYYVFFIGLLLANVINVWVFLLFHVIAISLCGYYVYFSYKRESDLNYSFLLFVSVLGTGPFGAFGLLIFSILKPILSVFALPAKKWFEGLFPEQYITPFEEIYRRIKYGWNDYSDVSEVTSFLNLFKYGALSQKQVVLDAIVKDFNPMYTTILEQALVDENNTVRIQAAAIVTKITLMYEMEIKQLLEKHKESPDEASIYLKLAQKYDNFASSGIIPKQRESELFSKTIDWYQKYLVTDNENRKIWFNIGRILFRMHSYEEFLAWTEEYKAKFQVLPDICESWYQESLYKLGRLEDLSKSIESRF